MKIAHKNVPVILFLTSYVKNYITIIKISTQIFEYSIRRSLIVYRTHSAGNIVYKKCEGINMTKFL